VSIFAITYADFMVCKAGRPPNTDADGGPSPTPRT